MDTEVQHRLPVSVSAAPLPPPGSIRIGPMMNVPALLRELGCDPGPVLAQVGLTPAVMSDPDMVVPFATIARMFRHCAQVTACDHFGLLLGQRAHAGCLGVVGFTMQNAGDVGTALENLVRYRDLHDQGALITLERGLALAKLRYYINDPDILNQEQAYDCAISVGHSMLREICGPKWRAQEVRLSRGRPNQVEAYQKVFGCPVRFSAGESCLVFDAAWLEKAAQGANPLLYRHMLREARELHEKARQHGGTLAPLLRVLLRGRRCSQDEAASLLGINRRTLSRRLQSEGTSFRVELELARFAQAQLLLSDASLTAAEVADRLGYADASTFSHAFKRWSGVSPGEWRRTALAAPPEAPGK